MTYLTQRVVSYLSPQGSSNFESSCGVCGGWGRARPVVTVGGQAAMDACWASSVMAAW